MQTQDFSAAPSGLELDGTPAGWRWRLNRLRCMTPAEIAFRLWRRFSIEVERRFHVDAEAVPEADLTATPIPWLRTPSQVDPAPYLAAADRVVAGRFDVFALRDVQLGTPPRWNRDCKTGKEAPLVFGKLLDYRDPEVVGDIKYLWEPNRHAHLVTLAQAYALSGDELYAETVRQHLESWFDACPPGQGANWSSALELGLRLISWSLTWQLLGGATSPALAGTSLRARWLDSIYRHQRFIAGYLSLHSSANNHLIGELSGLYIAGATWPLWRESAGWRARARKMLEREILLQNATDGVNREQAVAYQHFEIDLLMLTLLTGRAVGEEFSNAYQTRLVAMLEFLACLLDAGGNLPMFGDSDEGFAARLAPQEDFCPYRSLLASGAVLFRRVDFKTKARSLDDKTRWLFGAEAEKRFHALPWSCRPQPTRRAFPEGGYYILGRDFGSINEIRLVADAGPLGYRHIAAHGHADALSFTLSVGGMEFLIDPGTYAYHTHAAWRAYFRGTAAHNTVRIDGVDQSVGGGNFMWLKHARATCDGLQIGAGNEVFEGWHDGYQRLHDPVTHHRRIVLDKPGRRIVIEDRLKMAGEHDVELFFHVAEQCAVTAVDGGFALKRRGRQVFLTLPASRWAEITEFRGSVNPIAGWVSRRFDEKRPTTTLRWKAHLEGETLLRSEIQCS